MRRIFLLLARAALYIYLHIDISYNTFCHGENSDICLLIRYITLCWTIFRAILRLPEMFHLSQSSINNCIMVQIMPKANKM